MPLRLGLLTFLMINLAAPKAARADIIFINMNGSVSEIPAVQEAATQLGEKLYVLPATNTPGYKTPQLTQDLVRLAKLGVRPRAMVVSGHHVKNQGYFGSKGEVSLYGIGKYLPLEDSDVQSFFGSLQSLYLWGCYTGTLTNVDRLLKGYSAVFPNTKYVVGFADKAPISTKADSGKTLSQMVIHESQFRTVSGEQIPQLIKNISSQYDFIIHRGQSFATQEGFTDVDRFIESCQSEESKKSILQTVLLVWKYYWNEVGPLPEDTGKGPLREAYRLLQRNNFCLQMGAVELYQVGEIPPLSTVNRLIYYKNVVKNFSRIYMTQLAFAKKELESLGLQEGGFLTQLEQTERSPAIKKLQDYHKSLKIIFPNFQSNLEQRANYLYFYRMLNDIEAVIYPSEDYVPQSWIEPDATEMSWFRVLNDFAKGKAEAHKKARNQLGQ